MDSTKLCEIFNSEYPIMNAGMAEIALGDMAGAVSAAGGIGVIGGTMFTPQELRDEIEEAKKWTDGPLLVDILFPTEAPSDKDEIPLPDTVPEPVKELENDLEEKGKQIPDYDEVDLSSYTFDSQRGQELLEVALDCGVDGIATAVGTPEWVVEQAHDGGAKVVSLAGSPHHAVYAEQSGADIVIADGTEGGGHSGPASTMVLLPMVVQMVDVPVVAAGGIVHGSQIAASLAMGADGVWIGTRFVPTQESEAKSGHIEGILEMERPGETIRSEVADGLPIRMLENRFTEVWEGHEGKIRGYPEQSILLAPIKETASEIGDADYQSNPAGQGGAMIRETEDLPTVAEVMAELVEQTEQSFEQLATMYKA